MTIQCTFCGRCYEPEDGHTCGGNSVRPPYRRIVSNVATDEPLLPEATANYARDLLQGNLAKLRDEREAIDMDYTAYRLVHEPMVASLVAALAKIS